MVDTIYGVYIISNNNINRICYDCRICWHKVAKLVYFSLFFLICQQKKINAKINMQKTITHKSIGEKKTLAIKMFNETEFWAR